MAGLLDSGGDLSGGLLGIDPQALAASVPNPTINAPPSLWQRIAGGIGKFGSDLNTAVTGNPLLDMGLGIMASAGQLGGGVGTGALTGLQMYQQQRAAQLKQLLGQQQYGMNDARMRYLYGLLGLNPDGTSQSSQEGGLPSSPAAPGGAALSAPPPNAPGAPLAGQPNGQGTPGTSQPPAQPALPAWMTPVTQQTIAQTPLPYGMNPRLAVGMAALSNQDPTKAAAAIYAQQLKIQQQRLAPVISKLDTLRQSDNPVAYMQKDPELAAAWPRIAQQLGMDAANPTAQNVRTAMAYERNQLAGSVSEPTVAPPVPLQNVPGGINGTPLGQIDPVTRKYTPVTQPETANFVMPNGTIRMLPKAQGIAQGLTPYESDAYVSPGTQDTAALIADYKLAPLSGYALRTPQGQALMASVRRLNPNYDATQFDTKNRAREAFATGPQGDQVRRLDVSVDHLDTFGQLVDALNNHDVHAFAAIGQGFLRQFGSPAPTSFDAAKLFISNEITRGIIGGDAAEGDRKQVLDDLSRANSPAQLKGAISTFQRLLGGQLDGLRRQYKRATGLSDFDDALSPTALSQLPTPGATSTAPAAAPGAAAPGKVISWKDLP